MKYEIFLKLTIYFLNKIVHNNMFILLFLRITFNRNDLLTLYFTNVLRYANNSGSKRFSPDHNQWLSSKKAYNTDRNKVHLIDYKMLPRQNMRLSNGLGFYELVLVVVKHLRNFIQASCSLNIQRIICIT